MWRRLFSKLVIAISLVGAQSGVLSNIMKSLKMELPFRSILLLRNVKDADTCWTREDFDRNIPILNMNASHSLYLTKIFNSELLAVVCENRSEGDTIKALYRNLQDIRYTPTILVTQSNTNLSDLFEDCRSHKMLNVLALKDSDNKFVYSYRAFPHLQVVKRRVGHIRRYFEPQLRNMEGYQIKVLPDNVMPRTVVYRDARGRRQMTGYLAHLIRIFVSTLNATLDICWKYVPEEESISKMTMDNLAQDGIVDFPLVIASPDEYPNSDNIVMEISSWFLILPMEANTPRARLFYRIKLYRHIPIVILLSLVLSNAQRVEAGLGPSVSLGIIWDYVIRGFLAQPFVLPHGLSPRLMFIYGLLFLNTMLIVNLLNVNLESLLVHPPVDSQILSFQDMRLQNLKILVIPADFNFIKKNVGEENFQKILDIFEISNSTKVFQVNRISLNPAYAYPVTLTLWPLLQLSQARLPRAIFRRSREIQFSPVIILALPLPKNSIYGQTFTNFVGHSRESGLYMYWFRQSFNELIFLDKINYIIDNSTQPYQDLVWQDFFFIWLAYIGGILGSLLVFLVEVLYFKCMQGELSLSFAEAQRGALVNTLKALQVEVSFQSVLLVQNKDDTDTCWTTGDLDIGIPILNLDARQNFNLKKSFNTNMLALACLGEGIMSALYANLEEIRETPTLLVVAQDTNFSALFAECRSYHMLNVVAVWGGRDREFIYSYRAFPHLEVVRRRLRDIRRYFEPQVRDLAGHPIGVIPYSVLPRTLIFRDAHGDRQITGYLVQFYRNFARSLNTTLRYLWHLMPLDEMPVQDVVLATVNESHVDFPLVLSNLDPEPFLASSVLEVSNWFLILPVEPNVPRSSLYFSLRGWPSFLALMLLLALLLGNAHHLDSGMSLALSFGHIFGDHVLRAILAQSFVWPRRLSFSRTLLYILLMVAGLIISTFYSANLSTLLVEPPAAYRIRSFEDLRTNRVKILLSEQEVPLMNATNNKNLHEYKDTFEIIPSTVEFLAKRSALNNSYAYPVTSTLWPFLQIKQSHLQRPIFRRSQEIFFLEFMPLTAPMQKNSIYRKLFNQYVANTHASGLYELWFRQSFNKLVRMGKLNYSEEADHETYHDLIWEDYIYIWLVYIGGTVTSLLVFILELIFFVLKPNKPKILVSL
ncbi:uncharacterized protein [Drosophila pseudoobscura]|uniref:Uncharacterized protein n=1 Tax=Drosophila pseudoobscura pseudoobscura TaxID=46245 RepID=A0A6I8VR58_DROPS|nr:uncharacterized protein LOC6899054 [Drosophila pseudoobscura]